jgi:hypothetical protein
MELKTPLSRDPKEFTPVSMTIAKIPISFTPEFANGKMNPPIEKSFQVSSGFGRGIKELIISPNKKARAAIAAGLIIIKSAQPEMNAKKLPNDILKYSYSPPDSSVRDANALTVNAANKLITPARIQAIRIAVSLNPV